jgi:N-acetylmuramoyl-L-alanine amidase
VATTSPISSAASVGSASTAGALQEFQRNVALTPDGICGYASLRALQRLSSRADDGPSIASVREREELRHATRGLEDKRLVVGHNGGLGALTRTIARRLRLAGARVLEVDEPDALAHARAANRFGAELYLGLATGAGESYIAFYSVPGFESVGGKRMAQRLHDRLAALASAPHCTPRGMRLPVLRETRMSAVVYELGDRAVRVDLTPRIAEAVTAAVGDWVDAPVGE